MASASKVIVFLDGVAERLTNRGGDGDLVAEIQAMKESLKVEMDKTATDVPVSESNDNEDKDELMDIKLLDSKSGITPEKFGGNEEEFAEWNELYTGYLAIIDPKWETLLKTVREEKEKIKDVDDFLKKN